MLNSTKSRCRPRRLISQIIFQKCSLLMEAEHHLEACVKHQITFQHGIYLIFALVCPGYLGFTNPNNCCSSKLSYEGVCKLQPRAGLCERSVTPHKEIDLQQIIADIFFHCVYFVCFIHPLAVFLKFESSDYNSSITITAFYNRVV